MEIFSAPRENGKTIKAIKMAKELNGYLVVMNLSECERVAAGRIPVAMATVTAERPEIAFLLVIVMQQEVNEEENQKRRPIQTKRIKCGILLLQQIFCRPKERTTWAILEKKKNSWKIIGLGSKFGQ